MPESRRPAVVLSDRELLDAVGRDLRAIYSDVLRQPLPPKLAAALERLEQRSSSGPDDPAPQRARTRT